MGVPRSSSTGKVDYHVLRRLQRTVEGSARQMAGQRNHGQGHVFHLCASYLLPPADETLPMSSIPPQ
eukprot:2958953-Prymnesium_polylepis.1